MTNKEGNMENPHRHKLIMLAAGVFLLWTWAILPQAEDIPDQVKTDFDWIIFGLLNLVAVVFAHIWVSAPAREQKRREQYRMRRELKAAKRRHPTAR